MFAIDSQQRWSQVASRAAISHKPTTTLAQVSLITTYPGVIPAHAKIGEIGSK